MLVVILGTAGGIILAAVAQHYIRLGLRRWLDKQEQK
jgi:hypothetical protein